ncbi:hypothetical protein [Shewanella aestuarii]|uniref:DUF2850 domain-containing protein n=1 Tax=Shewanella aestuarii TaxID=1028752 RepID=A0A6G9QQH1_9GAMM|nr:hypothetical protein [Shewanella aestuarii]QIR16315.1 hypothetical protein HBH39_17670 [Shewanella aestuarii]
MAELIRKKWLLGVSVLIGLLMAGGGLYVNDIIQTDLKRERQLSLIGQWVSVDGFCDGKVGEINGLDITQDFLLVENGHRQKIKNMDVVSVNDMVGYCQGYGQFEFNFKVLMNTTELVEYFYVKTLDGTELLRNSQGDYYFRFTPQFKQRYESVRSETHVEA